MYSFGRVVLSDTVTGGGVNWTYCICSLTLCVWDYVAMIHFRVTCMQIELLAPVTSTKKAPPPLPPARRTLPRPPSRLDRKSAPPVPGRKDKKPMPLAVRTLKNKASRSRPHASSMPDLASELPPPSPSLQPPKPPPKKDHLLVKSQSANHIIKKSTRKARRLKKIRSTPATTEGKSSTGAMACVGT